MSARKNRCFSGGIPSAGSGLGTRGPTLLDLFAALCEETPDDREVVSAVLDLLRSRRVRRAAPVAPAFGF